MQLENAVATVSSVEVLVEEEAVVVALLPEEDHEFRNTSVSNIRDEIIHAGRINWVIINSPTFFVQVNRISITDFSSLK